MPVPVWAALLAVAVAKKAVVFTAAKVRQCRSKLLAVLLSILLPLSLDGRRFMASLAYIESRSSWRVGLYETQLR